MLLRKFIEYSFGYFIQLGFLDVGTLVSFHRRDGSLLGYYVKTREDPEKEDNLWRELEKLIKTDWLEHCWQM